MSSGRVLGLEYDRSVQDGIGTSYYLFTKPDNNFYGYKITASYLPYHQTRSKYQGYRMNII